MPRPSYPELGRVLTNEERLAITTLRRLAKRWPATLSLVVDGRSRLRVCDAAETEGAHDLGVVRGVQTGLTSNAHS